MLWRPAAAATRRVGSGGGLHGNRSASAPPPPSDLPAAARPPSGEPAAAASCGRVGLCGATSASLEPELLPDMVGVCAPRRSADGAAPSSLAGAAYAPPQQLESEQAALSVLASACASRGRSPWCDGALQGWCGTDVHSSRDASAWRSEATIGQRPRRWRRLVYCWRRSAGAPHQASKQTSVFPVGRGGALACARCRAAAPYGVPSCAPSETLPGR